MAEVAMLGFSAYSGTGKTTLIEGLIKNLRARGLRVGVIKHDAHHFLVDYKGKDSWRFSQAGAELSVVASAEKTALIEQRSLGFSQVAALMHDVDLILVEGYKQ
ncbi:MAG: molybdopterin-guanine dinucleotide biosynthesis protein B, partial [Clostridia bacterium]|nr:molybdopterin-guanine dinucleotide biosynthesis protein B [Clostridia bacterium]